MCSRPYNGSCISNPGAACLRTLHVLSLDHKRCCLQHKAHCHQPQIQQEMECGPRSSRNLSGWSEETYNHISGLNDVLQLHHTRRHILVLIGSGPYCRSSIGVPKRTEHEQQRSTVNQRTPKWITRPPTPTWRMILYVLLILRSGTGVMFFMKMIYELFDGKRSFSSAWSMSCRAYRLRDKMILMFLSACWWEIWSTLW